MTCITEELFDCIIDVGEQILLCGGEVNRAEDSLKRMFAAYNVQRTDVFIITSSLVVTVHTAGEQVLTQTRRITVTANHYQKLHSLNNLSREICQNLFSAQEISERLEIINNTKTTSLRVEIAMYAVIAAAFTLFFGGNAVEAVTSLVIGGLVRLIVLFSDTIIKNRIFTKFLSSLFAASIAYIAFKCRIIPTVDTVMVGNIMTLIPGIGFTTALKDLLVGDSIAGTLRTIEACMTAVAIAAGYFVVTFLTGGVAV